MVWTYRHRVRGIGVNQRFTNVSRHTRSQVMTHEIPGCNYQLAIYYAASVIAGDRCFFGEI